MSQFFNCISSADLTHLLYPRLQLEHVRLEVGGDLVSLVVERQPAVHKRQKLQEINGELGSTHQFNRVGS